MAPPSGGAPAAMSAATASVASPAAMMRGLPNRPTSRPVIGDSANMPNVCADRTIADRRQPMTVIGQVERRHRHDENHDHLSGRERDERHQDRGRAQQRAEAGGLGRLGMRGQGGRVRQVVGLRAQEDEHDRPRHGHEDQGEQVRAGERRQPERLRHHAGRSHQVRAAHRPDRRAPHHGGNRARPLLGGHEIGGDVAAELPGAVREAGQCAAGQQQRQRSGHARRRTRWQRRGSPTTMPSSMPGRLPTRSMRKERSAAAAAVPRVLVAVGSPPGAALPAISAAASVPAVTAAM